LDETSEKDSCDTDFHELDVLHPEIHVVKSGPSSAAAGSEVTYTFTVTNTGDVALSELTVVDSITGNGVYQSGDENEDSILDLTETWIYAAKYKIPSDQKVNIKNTVVACGNEYMSREDIELSESRLIQVEDPEIKVCDNDNHSLSIPQVLGDSITITPSTPVKLTVTGQNSSSSLVVGLVLISAVLFTTLNCRTTKSTKK
jgi:uncharacterized repeat protein (TIGR01451 family)